MSESLESGRRSWGDLNSVFFKISFIIEFYSLAEHILSPPTGQTLSQALVM